MTREHLQDVIVNEIEAGIQIVHRDYDTIDSWMRDWAADNKPYTYTRKQLEKAVNDLATNDRYFIQMAKHFGVAA